MVEKKKSSERSEQDKAYILEILNNYKTSLAKASSFHNKWQEYYKYYRSEIRKIYNNYDERRLLPIAFSTIMSILPRILMLKPEVRYIMRKYPDGLEEVLERLSEKASIYGYELDLLKLKSDAVKYMDYIIQWQWDKMRGDVVLSENILTSLIYGTSIIRVGWDRANNMPKMENIEPFYFYPDPSAKNPFDMNYCYIRSFMSVNTFKRLFKEGYFKIDDDNFDIDKMTGSLDELSTYKDIRTGLYDGDHTRDKTIEVIEYYSPEEFIYFYKDKVIRRVKNPLKRIPIVVNYNYVLPGEFWGMSEIDQIEQFILDMSKFRANRHINIELTNNNMWLLDPDGDVFLEDIVSAPGQIIRGKEGSIKPLVPPPISQATYQEDSVLLNDIRETSGISDYMRGSTPKRFETATAIENLVQSGNARINLRVMNLVEYVIKPLGELLIEYNKLFLKPITITVKEESGIRAIPIPNELIKMLDTEYDIIVIPNDTDKTRKEEFVQFMQLVFSNPQMAQMINIKELLKNMFSMWNISTYGLFKTDEEIKQEQQQAMMQQMMAMQQQKRISNGGNNGEQPIQEGSPTGAMGPQEVPTT